MSKALQERVEQLYQATKDLMSKEEIEPHCFEFKEWLKSHTNYSLESLGTKLSQVGFYKKFKSLDLKQNENAGLVQKQDGSFELRHWVILLCGLNPEQWQQRNETTRVLDRLGNDKEIKPNEYLETASKLLVSHNPHELAVGLIAVTGRRPHEILARAKFTKIEGKDYHVNFEGQGKKRGEKPIFEIATLVPGDFVIKALARLRKMPECTELKGLSNDQIDSRRNGSLNRVVREFYNPILPARHGEADDNCKALRAAYGCLATERDCKRAVGTKMLHFAQLLGHFVAENPNDATLRQIVTTLGYSDYYVTESVPFAPAPTVSKYDEVTTPVRAFDSDAAKIKELQKEWGLPNQQEVVKRLIELAMEAKAMRDSQFEQRQTTVDTPNEEQLNQRIEQIVAEKVGEVSQKVDRLEALLSEFLVKASQQEVKEKEKEPVAVTLADTPVDSPAPAPVPKPTKDWSSVPSEELKGNQAPGSAEEKIKRAVQAIMNFNDYSAVSNDERWAIVIRSVQALSGCNYPAVKNFMDTYSVMIADHNAKYGLTQYHNKRHANKDIDTVISW